MKKIYKIEDRLKLNTDYRDSSWSLTFATSDNMLVLADTLDSVVNKLNELIDQVNYLTDQLEEGE